MMKYRLMAPGPTPIPEEVLAEMAKPILHHRTPAFEKIMQEVQVGLKWLYQTQNDVILLACSGSGAMEACLVNIARQDDEILVVNAGKFGERFGLIAKAYGLSVDMIDVEWGHAVDVAAVEKKLSEKTYRAVCVQANETSTGVPHPIQAISEVVKTLPETLLIVDAITALGVVPIKTDDWDLDMVVCGSQKALMLPPGLATISVSEKAWKMMETGNLPKHYFDLPKERKAIHKNSSAYTPTVSLVMGLKVVLQRMQAEGLEAIFARHENMASAIRAAAQKIGLKLFAPEAPSNSVTSIYSPEGIDSGKIVGGLRDNFNMTIANGQDHVKGKIFRIGHIGYFDMMDMVSVWAAVERQLYDLGYAFELGSGVAEILKRL